MALGKDQKKQIIEEVSELLSGSKLTAFAHYPGTSVKDMQQLRSHSSQDGTVVRVIKNRLFKKALEATEFSKLVNELPLDGQLIYAFNDRDEVASARHLASFSKEISPLELVGGLAAGGGLLTAADIQALASLPTRDELRARLAGTLAAPMSSFTGVMAANIRSMLNVFDARTASLSNS